MATASAPSLPLSPPGAESPPRRRLSKVLTAGRRRSSDVQSDTAAKIRSSLESLHLTKSPTGQSHRSPSRDGSIRSSMSSGVHKLIPGHAKRERKKIREDELDQIAAEEAVRGRQPAPAQSPSPNPPEKRPDVPNRSHSSLVTVDSELESPPPLTSHDSHTGYLTTTSPLITTTTVDGTEEYNSRNVSTEQFPSIVEPPMLTSAPTSPKSPALTNIPNLPPSLPKLVDKADTLRPAEDPNRRRSKSPARRFKDVFARGGKSPRVSPERKPSTLSSSMSATSLPISPSPSPSGSDLKKINTSFGERRSSNDPNARGPSPLRSQTIPTLPTIRASVSGEDTENSVPKTPPAAIMHQPLTTVTPPTPTDPESRNSFQASPRLENTSASGTEQRFNNAQNAQNNHRRIQSLPGATHQRSKLSTSMIVPLTPTIEETKTPSPSIGSTSSRNVSMGGGGFFSSWVSAAQTAANSFTNLTNQNKSRTSIAITDTNRSKPAETPAKEEVPEKGTEEAQAPKKELAVTTLGSGDLNLSHLGIDSTAEKRAPSPARSEYAPSIRDDMAAQMEDMLAKRAVSQAYERPTKSGEATPVAELPDPVATVRPASTFDTIGTLTPPNGSIYEGETGGVRRTNSVRSKIQPRRSRGSSVTTSQSAIGAMIGASTATLANPATGPKLSGFAIAPKQRNRAFHQQFRSVPEDDFLIEDYSCALQKEILLAGRLYISEGHICFSSNILGWVTTLIISFEEVVSIEKENTAIVIPNAVAVQTLHARHTFRSLLSREATYDLMIGIWRVSHPDSFQKSMNGQKLAAGITSTENVTTNGEDGDAQGSESTTDDDSGSEDDENDSAPSIGSSGSMAGDEFVETKSLSRKPSGGNNTAPTANVAASSAPAAGDSASAVLPIVAAVDGTQDFPGPATHAPTDCTDSATHYDKVIKDEIIQAPLGKLYTLLYGPQSSVFVRKFLVDGVSKAQDLQMEEDKKGLDNEVKTRKYQYIKPLGGSIGPKQTNCITTEVLDFFDLEKAVSVTCTTQTPDVPSGSAFSTKTRYCLTWAPGNATRFQMNMTIEWTAKSWLKGPIEKGALDGQTQYGDDLVKTLKNALGRARATTVGSKGMKTSKKKRKSTKKEKGDTVQAETKKEDNWGPLEIVRPILGPVVAPIKPFVRTNIVVTILVIMVLWMWFRTPSTSALSRAGRAERLSYYDNLWNREESDLWEWLQDRAGIDGAIIRDSLQTEGAQDQDGKQKLKRRQKLLKSKDLQSRLREERKSMKEMEEAIRVTQERLDSLQRALERQKGK